MKTFPRFLSILITALLLIAIFSRYQGSLLIELTLPGGGARVQLEGAAKFQDKGLNSEVLQLLR